MELRKFDKVIDDGGATVATFNGKSAAGRKIVLLGGLGSNVDNLKPFAHHLNEQSGRSVSAVDITRADSLAEADRRNINTPYTHYLRSMLHLMAAYPGMSDIANEQLKILEALQPFSIGHHADAAEKAIRKHVTEDDAEDVDTVGHSWGTFLAEELTLRNDIVHDAVLFNGIAGVALWPDEMPSHKTMALMANPDRSPERLGKIAGDLYGGAFRDYPELACEAHIARVVDEKAYGRQVRCLPMSGLAIRNALPNIKNRVLVVGSYDDPITPWANSVRMSKLIPNATLVRGPNGHMTIATDPERCAKLVVEFLESPAALSSAA